MMIPKNLNARDYFASQALMGLLSGKDPEAQHRAQTLVEQAYSIALLMERYRKTLPTDPAEQRVDDLAGKLMV